MSLRQNVVLADSYKLPLGHLAATTKSFFVTVADVVLTLAFVSGVTTVNQPMVSAVEVLSAGRTHSSQPLGGGCPGKLPVHSAQVKPYPNLSADGRFTVELMAAFQS